MHFVRKKYTPARWCASLTILAACAGSEPNGAPVTPDGPPPPKAITPEAGAFDAPASNDGGASDDVPSAPDPYADVPLSEETGRVFYQILVRSFWDGQSPADGTGDLRGIIAKLPYLQELGVDTLLLMPVFASTGDMGYIPLDLFELEGAYGKKSDLLALTQAAHAIGMRIVLDAPVNHVGDGSAWFKRARGRDCQTNPGVAPECKYFYFSQNPGQSSVFSTWHKPWDWDRTTWQSVWQKPGPFNPQQDRDEYYYGTFTGVMPDLAFWDFDKRDWNKPVVDEIHRFFRQWAELGVDGFRIDAARHLVEGEHSNEPGEKRNLELLRTFLKQLRTVRKGSSFVAEAWTNHDEIESFLPDATDMALDFPFMFAVREGLDAGDNQAEKLKSVLRRFESKQEVLPIGHRVVFAGNHDVPRLWTYYQGNLDKIRMAHFLALLAPQVPLLFYGEEVGMEGDVKRPKPPADLEEWVRTDRVFPWDGSANLGFPAPPTAPKPTNASQNNLAAMQKDPQSLLSYVKGLLALRKAFPMTRETKLHVSTSFFGAMTAYTLATPQGSSFKCRTVVVNMSGGGPWTVNIQHQGAECANATLTEARAENAQRAGTSGATVTYTVRGFAKVVLDGP